jgi:archaeal flagellar protein FlaI
MMGPSTRVEGVKPSDHGAVAAERVRVAARLSQLVCDLDEHLPSGKAVKRTLYDSLSRNRRVRPAFADAWITLDAPPAVEVIATYSLPGATVNILAPADGSATLYWIVPDEYCLPVDDLRLLRGAMEHVRRKGGSEVRSVALLDARKYVEETALDFLRSAGPSAHAGPDAHEKDRSLASVVARYTVGLGVLEHLLGDPRVTDIYSDAPCGAQPLYLSLNLGDARVSDRLTTNITFAPQGVGALVTRARLEAGRPFSQARPYLEHDLKEFGARLTVIGPPVSPEGVAAAIRRHSSTPLTLSQLVASGALAPMTAGLLAVMVEGQCSLLIGGARGAGKTTLLGALMLEMDPCKRILTIEDTLELPVEAMRASGYRVQALRVRSSLGGEGEMSAEEALKLCLRLGESAIVVGEVRGTEAQTLYEAMRTGAASSSVMGTIHGSPASAVCARAIHDLGVSPESFAATDAIVIAGLVRPGGARRQVRRVTEVAEVTLESNTVRTRNLLRAVGASLEPTEASLEQSAVVQKVAGAGGVAPGEVVREVKARAELKLRMVALGQALGKPDVIGARATAEVNAEYARMRDAGLRGPALVQAVIDFARGKWA